MACDVCGLADAVLHYPFRAPETLAHLLTPIDETMRNWSASPGKESGAILSGVDAHAKLASRNAEPGDNRFTLPLAQLRGGVLRRCPRTSGPSNRCRATRPATPQLVMGAIRAGHLYTAVDGFATPPSFSFSATNAHGSAQAGDELEIGRAGVASRAQQCSAWVDDQSWQGTRILASERSHDLVDSDRQGNRESIVPKSASTIAMARKHGCSATPSTCRSSGVPKPFADSDPQRPRRWRSPLWTGDRRADGTWSSTRTQPDRWKRGRPTARSICRSVTVFRAIRLVGKSAALVWGPAPGTPAGMLAAYDRVTFQARAERPMRISVQLRALASDGRPRRRWQRSVYLDATEQDRTVLFRRDGREPQYQSAQTAARRGQRCHVRRRHDEYQARIVRAVLGQGRGVRRNRDLESASGSDREDHVHGGRPKQDVRRPGREHRRKQSAGADRGENAQHQPVRDGQDDPDADPVEGTSAACRHGERHGQQRHHDRHERKRDLPLQRHQVAASYCNHRSRVARCSS